MSIECAKMACLGSDLTILLSCLEPQLLRLAQTLYDWLPDCLFSFDP